MKIYHLVIVVLYIITFLKTTDRMVKFEILMGEIYTMKRLEYTRETCEAICSEYTSEMCEEN